MNRSLLYYFKTLNVQLLTLILPNPKVTSLCHQYRARPACTSGQSDQAIYTVGRQTSCFYLDMPKIIMDSSKNVRWIIPFKEFGMVGLKGKNIFACIL